MEPAALEGKFAFGLFHLLQGLLLVDEFMKVVFEPELKTLEHALTCLKLITGSPVSHWRGLLLRALVTLHRGRHCRENLDTQSVRSFLTHCEGEFFLEDGSVEVDPSLLDFSCRRRLRRKELVQL